MRKEAQSVARSWTEADGTKHMHLVIVEKDIIEMHKDRFEQLRKGQEMITDALINKDKPCQ